MTEIKQQDTADIHPDAVNDLQETVMNKGNENPKKSNEMDKSFSREQSISLLNSPSTWCKGAEQLTKLGNPEDILQLLKAYRLPAESGKLCLLDGMQNLGALEYADQLFSRPGKETKLDALYLMKLFPDERHLPNLSQAVSMPDEQLRSQALNALLTQIRTPGWIQTMLKLLNHENESVRLTVVNELARHKSSPGVITALKSRMETEPSDMIKSKIKAITQE